MSVVSTVVTPVVGTVVQPVVGVMGGGSFPLKAIAGWTGTQNCGTSDGSTCTVEFNKEVTFDDHTGVSFTKVTPAGVGGELIPDVNFGTGCGGGNYLCVGGAAIDTGTGTASGVDAGDWITTPIVGLVTGDTVDITLLVTTGNSGIYFGDNTVDDVINAPLGVLTTIRTVLPANGGTNVWSITTLSINPWAYTHFSVKKVIAEVEETATGPFTTVESSASGILTYNNVTWVTLQ